MVSGAPDYWLKGKYIELIETINRIKLIDEITKIAGITNITNLANIQSVDLIDRITLIDEITKIGELTNLRDLLWAPKSLIQNPLWTQGLAGWIKYGTVDIITETYGNPYLRFSLNVEGRLMQIFPLALDTTWFTEIYFWLRSATTGTNLIYINYYYTDGSFDFDVFQVTAAASWQRKVLSPTAGKIEYIEIEHKNTSPICDLKELIMVF